MAHKKNVIILGAGMAGLSAGYFLSRKDLYAVTVLEKEPVVGGMCRSFQHGGFTLDYGAHKIYSVIPGVMEEIKNLLGDRAVKQRKRSRIFLKGRLIDYPLRMNNLLKVLGLPAFLALGGGYGLSTLKGWMVRKPVVSYQDYMIKILGEPAYQLIFEPLADKVWGQPDQLHPELARTRMPSSEGWHLALRLLKLKKETQETNAQYFLYPPKGFGDFPQKLREEIIRSGHRVLENVTVMKFDNQDGNIRAVEFVRGGKVERLPCDLLISSIPLAELSRLLTLAANPLSKIRVGTSASGVSPDKGGEIESPSGGFTPGRISGADKGRGFENSVHDLQFRQLILVYLFLNQDQVLKDQWIYFPEREFVFNRIFEQKQFSVDLGPPGRTVLCCDMTCDESSWIWSADDETLSLRCIKDLEWAGIIRSQDVQETFVKKFPNFYPRYDLYYQEKLRHVFHHIRAEAKNLLLTGRLGMYNYNNADHCFDMGRLISEQMEAGKSISEIWAALEQRIKAYRIID